MLKAVICFLIIAVCGAAGALYARRYRERAAFLAELDAVACQMRDDISVKKRPVADAAQDAAKRTSIMRETLLTFASGIREEPRQAVSDVWEASCAQLGDSVKKRDAAIAAELGEGIDLLCAKNSDVKLGESSEEIRRELAAIRSKERAKTQSYVTVGFLAGIFIAVLIY